MRILQDKLKDEIIARLAELAEAKVGRLTFHFAQCKLNELKEDVAESADFIKRKRFHEKRNYDISHKELPEKWTDHKFIHISYSDLVRGAAMALRLMKKIDKQFLGPHARHLWREMRRRRYEVSLPARESYMLLPYLWLSEHDRLAIIKEEIEQGRDAWKEMVVQIHGNQVAVQTYGELGALVLDGQLMLLPESFVDSRRLTFLNRRKVSSVR